MNELLLWIYYWLPAVTSYNYAAYTNARSYDITKLKMTFNQQMTNKPVGSLTHFLTHECENVASQRHCSLWAFLTTWLLALQKSRWRNTVERERSPFTRAACKRHQKPRWRRMTACCDAVRDTSVEAVLSGEKAGVRSHACVTSWANNKESWRHWTCFPQAKKKCFKFLAFTNLLAQLFQTFYIFRASITKSWIRC